MRIASLLLIFAANCSSSEPTNNGSSKPSPSPTGSSSSTRPPGTTPDAGPKDNPADTTPRVRFVGRSDGTKIAWPGTRVIVRFKGPALRAKLIETSMDGGPAHYDLTVDGARQTTHFVPKEGEGSYDLASNLAPAEAHVVELYRRNEGSLSVTDVASFEYPSGGELLAPPPFPTRKIEVVGDSESNGYGIECTSPSQNFSAATQNARKAYPELVAIALEAEVYNISFSGKGVLRNSDDNDRTVMSDLYPLTLPSVGSKAWEFAAWVPDVVVIALGQNDWSPGANDRGAPNEAAFKTKYGELIALARSKNPNAQILCAITGSANDDYPEGWQAHTKLKSIVQSLVEELRATDPKIHFHDMPRVGNQGTGCDYHPSATFNEQAAPTITAKIREITGW